MATVAEAFSVISDSGHTGVALLKRFGAIANLSQNDGNITPKDASDDEARNGHSRLEVQGIDERNAGFLAGYEPPGAFQHVERTGNATDVYAVRRRIVEPKIVLEAR